jgi:hypothetical protein
VRPTDRLETSVGRAAQSRAALNRGTVEANATPTGGLEVSVRLPRRDTVVIRQPVT